MIKHAIPALVALTLTLSACAGTTPTSGDLQIKAKPTSATVQRSFDLNISGPSELAVGGQILTDGGAGLFDSAGRIVAGGAGNIVAGGAGNIVAGGAGNYNVFASDFTAIGKAGVMLTQLDGTPVTGKALEANASGKVKLEKVPDGKPLVALVAYKVGDKVYRQSVLIGTGTKVTALMVDPINTMIEAWMRKQILAKGNAALPSTTELAEVWTICDNASISVSPADLAADKTQEEIQTTLIAVWKSAIEKVSGDDKVKLTAFIGKVEKAK